MGGATALLLHAIARQPIVSAKPLQRTGDSHAPGSTLERPSGARREWPSRWSGETAFEVDGGGCR
jgi:hypothetical protein